MTSALVVADTNIHSIRRVTQGILGKLSGYHVEVAVLGDLDAESVALIREYNPLRIHLLKGEALYQHHAVACIKALCSFIENNQFDVIFSGATSITCDIFPAMSAHFGTGFAAGVNDFYFSNNSLFGTKKIYGGKCLVNIELLGPKPWFMTVIPDAVQAVAGPGDKGSEIVEHHIPDIELQIQIKNTEPTTSNHPLLANADIVVSGGRGLHDRSNLKLLEELADVLGAALGASGGAVSSDLAPSGYLIGKTGANISPILYIACGISGATQHLDGIRGASKIMAINTDANAPLMRIADYAVVGDIKDVVSELTRQLRQRDVN